MLYKSKLQSQFIPNRIRTHTLLILIGMLFFVILIIYASIKIYKIALDETKRNHQLLQREMAMVSVSGINHYLSHVSEDLKFLMNSPCLKSMVRSNYESFLENFFDVHKASNLRAIFIADSNFNMLYAMPESISKCLAEFPVDNLIDLQLDSNQVWYSPVFPQTNANCPSQLSYLMVVRLIENSMGGVDSGTEEKSRVYLGMIASFDWLIDHYVVPLNIGTTVSAWLMDKNGRLLYHPRHPEMVLRSITEDSPDCITCHASFGWQKQMLASSAAFGEYSVGSEPTKIMTHMPLDIKNERWILVISSNLSDVTSVLRSKFSLFFIIVLIILLLTMVVGVYFYKLNIERIRAEEAQRLSEQKELLHLQTCQSSKLASVGELVDTVAHEINTPVSIIVAQTQVLDLNKSNKQHDFADELRIIKEQAQRISKYTLRLLNYSQNMPFNPKPGDLKKIMEECLYLLGPRFRAHKIVIRKNYAPNLSFPIVDKSQIEQVFINLLNNAIDAIHINGQITINIHPYQKESGQEGIQISIMDNGEGIPKESMPNIFKAFFTTKQPNKGTGLGLPISRAIVQRHGGKISVASEPGIDTTFTIFLPIK